MDGSISLNISPLQVILSLLFQLWIVVFPIIIIRKLNYLTNLMQELFENDDELPVSSD